MLIDQVSVDERIVKWLNSPDPSINFVTASNNTTEGTGNWLIENKDFNQWNMKGILFWLQGKGILLIKQFGLSLLKF